MARSREGTQERAEIRAQPAIRDFRLRLTGPSGTRHTSSLHPVVAPIVSPAALGRFCNAAAGQAFAAISREDCNAPKFSSGANCFSASAGDNGR
ncbi:MAG TPA: hypothetical protein VK930_12120, partial [Verrucomicrobiae bacterium]|nr:hypothetical protein [Verrucomicrobiae bacterium]